MNGLRQIEQGVFALGREWTRVELEKRLQQECHAMPRVSARTGQELRRVRRRPMELDTVAGKVKLLAPRGYEPQSGQWISPAREAWGLADYERKTPELQARLTHTVTAAGSYVEAQELAATWGTPVSDGCIHQQVAKLKTLQTLKELRDTATFKPFEIHLSDGRALTVAAPDHLFLMPNSSEFLVVLADGGFRFVDATQVVSAGRNGRTPAKAHKAGSQG